MTQALLIGIIGVSLIFLLTNGLNDASAVVATIISCGAASPRQAVCLAALAGMAGSLFGGSAVAGTIVSVIHLPVEQELLPVLLAAVTGAVAWNGLAWRFGIPSSSTHALIGGIIGAVIAAHGPHGIVWGAAAATSGQLAGVLKILLSLVLSPLLGFGLAFLLTKLLHLALRNARATLNGPIKKVQWVLSAWVSCSRGANDLQKLIGLLALALAAAGGHDQAAPFWLRVLGGAVMSMGTLLGGWAVMRTIGRGIYDMRPVHSFSSQLASAGSLLVSNLSGAPVSTTHIVVGSVMGVGVADDYRMVRWNAVRQILLSWLITIPFAAAVAAALYELLRLIV